MDRGSGFISVSKGNGEFKWETPSLKSTSLAASHANELRRYVVMSETEGLDDVCVYCGSTEALTDDHVPPQTLFPKPRPSNLITVRSCLTCNGGSSKDDEYFRLMISMRHDTGDHPAVKKILPSIYRSMQKPNKKGFQQSLFNSMGDLDINSRGGIYLGTVAGYNADLRRLDRVAARITAGLYFHDTGTRVPDDRHVKAYSASGLTHVDSNASTRIIDICHKVTRNPPKIFGENVFAYWFQQVENDPTMGAWILAFYEKVLFLCLVASNEDAPANKAIPPTGNGGRGLA